MGKNGVILVFRDYQTPAIILKSLARKPASARRLHLPCAAKRCVWRVELEAAAEAHTTAEREGEQQQEAFKVRGSSFSFLAQVGR